MGETNRVVARFLDGRMLKGTTQDFLPNRPSFHVHPLGSNTPEEVRCGELKAVFFVKDFAGNPQRRDHRGFADDDVGAGLGKKIVVKFKDGEVICGYTLAYTTERDGFFMTPADVGSNNVRIYVLARATREVGVGAKAEGLMHQLQNSRIG